MDIDMSDGPFSLGRGASATRTGAARYRRRRHGTRMRSGARAGARVGASGPGPGARRRPGRTWTGPRRSRRTTSAWFRHSWSTVTTHYSDKRNPWKTLANERERERESINYANQKHLMGLFVQIMLEWTDQAQPDPRPVTKWAQTGLGTKSGPQRLKINKKKVEVIKLTRFQ